MMTTLVRGVRAVLRPAADPDAGTPEPADTPGPLTADPAGESAAHRVFCCGGTAPRCFCPVDLRHR